MAKITKQPVELNALDQLHRAYKKNEFVTMATSLMLREDADTFADVIWEGFHLVMLEIGQDIKDALVVLD